MFKEADWKEIGRKNMDSLAKKMGFIKGVREDGNGNKTNVYLSPENDIIVNLKEAIEYIESKKISCDLQS